VPLPRVNSGMGRVSRQVKAVGLNFADVFTVLGMYDAAPRGERHPLSLIFFFFLIALEPRFE